jgi:hypothetical protein
MVGNLAQVLTGIAALKKGEMNAVKNAVKERLAELKKNTIPPRVLLRKKRSDLLRVIQRRVYINKGIWRNCLSLR